MSITISGVVHEGDWEAGVPATFTEAQANFANGNFVMIAEYLGLPLDPDCLAGTWDASDVKGRCATALAVGGTLDDNGVPGAVDGGPGTGRCTWIDPGLRPGYFADAAATIEEVADECLANGVNVQFA